MEGVDMLGKAKCKILKEIRQKIADENDIPYVTRECTYQGDCSGTCPKCESELRYLERELERRQRLGKAVAVTALCAGITAGTAACGTEDPYSPPDELGGATTEEISGDVPDPSVNIDDPDIAGNETYDPAYQLEGETEIAPLMGEPDVLTPELGGSTEIDPDYTELAGDVDYSCIIPPKKAEPDADAKDLASVTGIKE